LNLTSESKSDLLYPISIQLSGLQFNPTFFAVILNVFHVINKAERFFLFGIFAIPIVNRFPLTIIRNSYIRLDFIRI